MSTTDYAACLANLVVELRKAERKFVEAKRWRDQLEHDVRVLKLRGYRVDGDDISPHLDFVLPNESEARGLSTIRDYFRPQMERDDSQQYIDDTAALAWIERAISAASSSEKESV